MNRVILLFLIFTVFEGFGQNSFIQEGIASFYADKFEGRLTASGEKYRHSKLTAAHKTLPFGTLVRVTNLTNNKSVVVKVNDRGPYAEGRVIDLSRSAAENLDFIVSGLVKVKLEIVESDGAKESQYDPGKPNQTDLNVDEKEFYEFSVKRFSPGGFGVQIGSFQEMVNLVRLSENLRKSYRKRITVQVSVINKMKVYKIIIGPENTRAKAEALKRKLAKKYPDCFIIDFRKL